MREQVSAPGTDAAGMDPNNNNRVKETGASMQVVKRMERQIAECAPARLCLRVPRLRLPSVGGARTTEATGGRTGCKQW